MLILHTEGFRDIQGEQLSKCLKCVVFVWRTVACLECQHSIQSSPIPSRTPCKSSTDHPTSVSTSKLDYRRLCHISSPVFCYIFQHFVLGGRGVLIIQCWPFSITKEMKSRVAHSWSSLCYQFLMDQIFGLARRIGDLETSFSDLTSSSSPSCFPTVAVASW